MLLSRTILAESHNKIKIIGNKNIDNEIIFSIIDEKITDYSTNNLNEIIKTLYETGNFKKVEVEKSNNEIILKIEENPSIDKIRFDGNKRFKDDEIFEHIVVPAQKGKVVIKLERFQGGTLAASVYHDENGDGKLNTGHFWRPKEGFAFSNEYEPKAMPQFSKAAVEVSDGQNITVQLNY